MKAKPPLFKMQVFCGCTGRGLSGVAAAQGCGARSVPRGRSDVPSFHPLARSRYQVAPRPNRTSSKPLAANVLWTLPYGWSRILAIHRDADLVDPWQSGSYELHVRASVDRLPSARKAPPIQEVTSPRPPRQSIFRSLIGRSVIGACSAACLDESHHREPPTSSSCHRSTQIPERRAILLPPTRSPAPGQLTIWV
jgi:hypothetical protein